MAYFVGCSISFGHPIRRMSDIGRMSDKSSKNECVLVSRLLPKWTNVRRFSDTRLIGCPDPGGRPVPVTLPTDWVVRLAAFAL